VVSQGLALPLSIFNELSFSLPSIVNPGLDVTEAIGVKKYEKQIPTTMQGLIAGDFPSSLVPKTDEENIQNVKRVINELAHIACYVSIKLDGSSGTYTYQRDGSIFKTCSRNWEKKRPIIEPSGETKKDAFWEVVKKYDLEERIKNIGRDIAIQGEVVGPGISGNKLNLKEIDFYVFNAYDIASQRYLDVDDMLAVVATMKLKHVPIIYKGQTLAEILNGDFSLEALLKLAQGNYEGTECPREGVVIRPCVETYSETLRGRMSVKVKNNDYLIKFEE
jgi:RNA ligase (TIGR02306 family)